MKRQLQRFAAFSLLSLLAACSGVNQAGPSAQVNRPTSLNAQQTRNQVDRFLCVVEPGEQGSTVKVMNLANRQIRAVYLPGFVQSMDADRERNKLYLSVRSAGPRFDLYELDVNTLTLNRPASFSQAGLNPVDFKVRDQQIFVAGRRDNRGMMLSYNLQQGGWTNLAFDFLPGRLEWSQQANLIQSVYFDEDNLIRSTIDVAAKRVLKTQTFPHDVPFGNNIGLAAPDGEFFYALHQLQGQVEIYAFDINKQQMTKDVNAEKAVGILFQSSISKDGRFLYATIDNRLERYELQGTTLRRLPPITLNAKEARYLTLSNDQRTIYVTHDGKASISRIRLAADNVNYAVDEVAFPGQNTEITVF